jgi:glyoxylase-like metal-dependent hydrolase (beta-lactamase superfamily II)
MSAVLLLRAGAKTCPFILALAAAVASAQEVKPSPLVRAPMIQAPPAGQIEVLPIRGNLYALIGAGANVVISVGGDGVFIVDTGRADMSDTLLRAIRQVQRDWALRNEPRPLGFGAETRSTSVDRHVTAPPKPIRYIVNTSGDPEVVGGNEKLNQAGRTFTGGNVAVDIRDSGEGAAILAHENVMTRVTKGEGEPALTGDALPTLTYYTDAYKLSHFFNGEGIQLLHVKNGHTNGDSIVYFRGSDVIALGGLMSSDTYPRIDTARGGSITGVIDGLNKVLDLAIPEFRLEGGTMMVPGDGRLVDSGDVAYYRDMLTIIRDRVADLIKKEMTLDEVLAARPTADYDTQYSAKDGPASSRAFIEAVYKSLGGGKPAAPPARRGRR